MKVRLVIVLCLISIVAWSQTEQLEKENINNRFKNGEFNVEAFGVYANDWREMMKSFGTYPELPYDEESGMIKFKIIEETGQPKKINYQRIMEWAAINFGALSSVLHYENYESGKIILKGSFDITHKNEYRNFWGKPKEGLKKTKCNQTFIFTVKDNTIKAEVIDVRYEFTFLGYSSATMYIPDRNYEVSIHHVYPITNFDSREWKEKLDLLNQTNVKINWLVGGLSNYIKEYENDIDF
ncbi:MAG: DUF4468 domain-containing protein [Bacteroidales bacterium]|jgi:hypothetical protein|nr:DUF4468 domain-containing protein [Bacteroidales bacterium]